MALNELSYAPGTAPPSPKPEVTHAMRELTLEVAFENAWTEEAAVRIADMFSSMAADWTAGHDNPGRDALLHDALDRGNNGQRVSGERALELGSGTGLGTRELAKRFPQVIALDRSQGMLEEAPAEYGPRVLADAAALPVQARSIDVLVLVNMILFPAEADRVLSPGGSLVWINTFGEHTPIHLTADEVDRALPGEWNTTHSRAGTGTWAVSQRK